MRTCLPVVGVGSRRRFAAALLVLVVAGLVACKFDSSSEHGDPKLRPTTARDAGSGGSGIGGNGGNGGAGSPSAVGDHDAGNTLPGMDAAVAMMDATTAPSDAAVDAGNFGDNPTPDDPDAPMQNGGPQCGG